MSSFTKQDPWRIQVLLKSGTIIADYRLSKMAFHYFVTVRRSAHCHPHKTVDKIIEKSLPLSLFKTSYSLVVPFPLAAFYLFINFFCPLLWIFLYPVKREDQTMPLCLIGHNGEQYTFLLL